MDQNQKQGGGLITVLFIGVVIGWCVGHFWDASPPAEPVAINMNPPEGAPPQPIKTQYNAAADQRIKQEQSSVSEMARKYAARTDWRKALKDSDSHHYTIDAQEALFDGSMRPLLLFGNLEDIELRDGKYHVTLGGYDTTCPDSWFLEITQQQCATIRGWASGHHDLTVLAVVARVTSMKAVPTAEGDSETGDVFLEFESKSIIVSGDVVDVTLLDEDRAGDVTSYFK